MVGMYKSVVIFSPLDSVISYFPSGVFAEPETLVETLMLTWRFCNCLVAVFETLAGVPSRTVEPLAIWGLELAT